MQTIFARPTRPDAPRPLTDSERQALRDRVGGFASPDQLAALATGPKRAEREPDQNRNRRGRNGWA